MDADSNVLAIEFKKSSVIELVSRGSWMVVSRGSWVMKVDSRGWS